jgi:hypothetical protein
MTTTRVHRHVDAPRAEVYAALLDPASTAGKPSTRTDPLAALTGTG